MKEFFQVNDHNIFNFSSYFIDADLQPSQVPEK